MAPREAPRAHRGLQPGAAPTSALDALTLRMRYDDGFALWLNGVPLASANSPTLPAWDSVATARNPNHEAVPVSYTHFRAHETVLDLVCRLLLDKNTA